MSLVLLAAAGALCGMVGGPGPEGQERKSDPLGVLYFLCNVHCTTFTVFLRYGFGSEALGFPGLGALILIFVSMSADPLMQYWLVAFLVALVIQRITTSKLLREGCPLHSMDSGLPLLMKFFRSMKKRTALTLEALFCLLAGALLLPVSEFIGQFLLVGFFSLTLRTAIEASIVKRRLQRMRDAELEQRWLSERYRSGDNDY